MAENIAQACTLLIGLAFKDGTGLSVFPLAPVEILWIIMITSSFPDMGLGWEPASDDVMIRPPHDASLSRLSIMWGSADSIIAQSWYLYEGASCGLSGLRILDGCPLPLLILVGHFRLW